MRGKSIAQALRGLGSDPELLRSLFQLNDTLRAVLTSDTVACEHCGRMQLAVEDVTIDLLAERLLTVVEEIQERTGQPTAKGSRAEGPSTKSRKGWARSRPDLPPGARHSKSRGRLGGGTR